MTPLISPNKKIVEMTKKSCFGSVKLVVQLCRQTLYLVSGISDRYDQVLLKGSASLNQIENNQ